MEPAAIPQGALRYGWFRFRPGWLQGFNRPLWYTLVFSLCGFSQSICVAGLLGVNISTIEKRFGYSSRQTGVIVSVYEGAGLVVIFFVGYFGGRGSRPKWIGLGMLLLSAGSFLFAMPHFISDLYDYGQTLVQENTCQQTGGESNLTTASQCEHSTGDGSSHGYMWLFNVANILHGVGSAPLYTLGLTYMDDITTRDKAALYIGVFYAWTTIGPAITFAGAGYLLKFYTDIDQGVEPDIVSSDPRWVGAWWIGYLVTGSLSLLMSLPMIGFPKYMPQSARIQATRQSEAHEDGRSEDPLPGSPGLLAGFKDVQRSFRVLLTNPTYMFQCGASFTDALLVTGFSNFGPKFIQSQFSLTPGMAGALFGAIAVPGGAGGSFVGSWLVKRFNMSCQQLLKWMFFLTVSCVFLCSAFFIQCDNAQFAGVNHNYAPQISPWVSETADLSASCNAQCQCSQFHYSPVCGADNILYFSPCYAGCSERVDNDRKEYSNCTCLDVVNGTLPLVRAKPCDMSCDYMPLFIIVFMMAMFATFVMGIFSVYATMRCVPDELKSLAISGNWFGTKLLGSLPGPILFGAILDYSCTLWEQTCDDSRGSCLYYQNSTMAWCMMGITASCKVLASVFTFLAWRSYKPPKNTNLPVSTEISDVTAYVSQPDDVIHSAQDAQGVAEDAESLTDYKDFYAADEQEEFDITEETCPLVDAAH